MPTVEAVYENGVFRPLAPVDWRDGTRVTVEQAAQTPADFPTVRDLLARRYSSGQTDTAARHNEHQP